MAKAVWVPPDFLHAPSGSTRDVGATQRQAGACAYEKSDGAAVGRTFHNPSPPPLKEKTKEKAGPNAQTFLIRHHFLRPEPPKGFRPEARSFQKGEVMTFHKKKLWNVEAENHEMKLLKIMKWRKNRSTFKHTCIFESQVSFFPEQFTVGVLNATLDLAALVLVGVVGFLGSEVVLSPVVSGCLPSCGGWVLVGVAASRTKIFRNQNHRFQFKFAYCKLFGVYAGVIFRVCTLVWD